MLTYVLGAQKNRLTERVNDNVIQYQKAGLNISLGLNDLIQIMIEYVFYILIEVLISCLAVEIKYEYII